MFSIRFKLQGQGSEFPIGTSLGAPWSPVITVSNRILICQGKLNELYGISVRLTPDERSRQGAIWNKVRSPGSTSCSKMCVQVPCRVRNWEVQLSFKVTGSTKDLFGDGFAFWYVRDRMQAGPVFGSKDQFSGLAIIAGIMSNVNKIMLIIHF